MRVGLTKVRYLRIPKSRWPSAGERYADKAASAGGKDNSTSHREPQLNTPTNRCNAAPMNGQGKHA